MAEWIALDRLLLEARPQRSVGLCDGEVIDHAGFRQRVLAWRAAFAAAEGRDWALYFDDAVASAAALFGAWHAGKRVFLAADNLPATLQALQPQVSGFAGDVSADYRSLVALDAALDDELQALDERACELCVFTSGSTGQPSAIGKRLDQLAREVELLQPRQALHQRWPEAQAGAEHRQHHHVDQRRVQLQRQGLVEHGGQQRQQAGASGGGPPQRLSRAQRTQQGQGEQQQRQPARLETAHRQVHQQRVGKRNRCHHDGTCASHGEAAGAAVRRLPGPAAVHARHRRCPARCARP